MSAAAAETSETLQIYADQRKQICEQADRLFLWLLLIEWLAAVLTAIWASPHMWSGSLGEIPPLVTKAFLLGGAITGLPIYVSYKHPGTSLTRQEIAIGQGLVNCLLIHLSGGHDSMHYVVFASLAFLAAYRDTSLLVISSGIVMLDHVLAAAFWPRSVYGVPEVKPWAWVHHGSFIAIEIMMLALVIRRSQQELLGQARKQAALNASRGALEREVAERQRTERLLALQYLVTRVLAGADSLSEATPLLLRIIGGSHGWQIGELWLVDDNQKHLHLEEAWHAGELSDPELHVPRSKLVVEREVALAGRVWALHEPLWIEDLAAERDLQVPPALRYVARLRGGFGFPLRHGGQVNGVMVFMSRETQPPDDDHLSMVSALGSQIGQFIERKRIEQGLKDSEERYRSVITALDEGIVLVDAGGRLVALNGSAERIIGSSAQDVIGRACSDWFASPVREDGTSFPAEALPMEEVLRTGEPRSNVVIGFARAPGERAWISLNAQPLRRGEERAPYAAVASFSDITARKQAEESLRAAHAELEVRVESRTRQLVEANSKLQSEVEERERVQRELRKAKELADGANRAKSAFLANMSHELRTPLNAVIGFSELLEQEIFGPLNDKQRSYVANVLISGRHLLQLVNDILDISKVEAGRMDLACEWTPLGGVADVVGNVLGALATKKGVTLELAVPEDLPRLYIDPGRIKQVLYNLLSNGIKFTPSGGCVRLAAQVDGDAVVVSVRDTGVGIAHENLPRLFREFEQISPTPDGPRPEGTGLGLALTRRLVELHGGTVGVESELGKGTTFSVRLPLAPREASAPVRQAG